MVAYYIISILIHIFTILAIVILYQRRSLERLNLPTLQDDVETIHHSMESFIDEIEKENEVLYNKLKNYVQNKESKLEQRIQYLEEKLEDSNRQWAEQIEEENVPEKSNEQEEYMFKTQQVVDLYHQGFNVEQISKTLQIGTGETNLIINMINKSKIID